MRPFAMANEGSWDRLKAILRGPVPDLGTLGPPETRSRPPFPPDALLGDQLNHVPTPFDRVINSVRASLEGDFKALGADQLDAFLFTFGPVVKDLALGDETARLQMHMRLAIEDFNEIGYTPRQAAALVRKPHLAGAMRGHQIDRFVKIRIGQDEHLPHLRLTLPGRFGPDIYDPRGFRWWDVTTPGSWARHVPRYGFSFGTGTPLLTR
jgi:hypothetical protein